MRLTQVSDAFGLEGSAINIELIKNGNIHATYKVTVMSEIGDREYILQKINTYVFKCPEEISLNIRAITDCLRRKTLEDGGDPEREVMNYRTTRGGDMTFTDSDGDMWRCYDYIGKSVTFNECSDPEILRGVGRAFGLFQKRLSDFDAASLYMTIPDFHNTKKRLKVLEEAVESDPLNRAREMTNELDFIMKNADKACVLGSLSLPLRVTHNDTKSNNVLFDAATKKPLAVIDLDTVMPGLAAHDFGDGVRFAANAVAEDEADFSKVSLDIEKYRAFTEGFIGETAGFLSAHELETLYLGVFTITLELASRFALDYLSGDNYFITKYPGHNLVRAKSQMTLAKDMLKKEDLIRSIIVRSLL